MEAPGWQEKSPLRPWWAAEAAVMHVEMMLWALAPGSEEQLRWWGHLLPGATQHWCQGGCRVLGGGCRQPQPRFAVKNRRLQTWGPSAGGKAPGSPKAVSEQRAPESGARGPRSDPTMHKAAPPPCRPQQQHLLASFPQSFLLLGEQFPRKPKRNSKVSKEPSYFNKTQPR